MRLKIILTLLCLLTTSLKVNADRSLHCMAQNVYFEAASESFIGQIAVAQVVMNRVESEHFPDNPCDVIYEGPSYISNKGNILPIKHRCQFSWYCDGKPDTILNLQIYGKILDLVDYLIPNGYFDITDGATHYHADYVRPDWAKTKTKTIEIEDHIFYRWEK